MLCCVVPSCKKDNPEKDEVYEGDGRVMLLYSAGYNSLSTDLQEDISDIKSSWLPRENGNILLVYTRSAQGSRNYTEDTKSYLIRLYSNSKGKPVADTVNVWPATVKAASSETVREVLTYVNENFPAESYGMVFSSHATGWLPAGYYNNNSHSVPSALSDAPVLYSFVEQDSSLPRVKSVGQDVDKTTGTELSYEMTIESFASAIPMTLDYILFDACLMACVETAYALKDKCHYVGFSPTEVLANGFDYAKLATRLLKEVPANPEGVCRDYFDYYEAQSGAYQSATISFVDCTKLDALALTCNLLFDKYRENMAKVDGANVQGFFRSNKHWFYDLKDIVSAAGATEHELEVLQTALDKCVVYKGATAKFINFDINTYCGLTMYLPSMGNSTLDEYYSTLSWNQATGLVSD